MCGIAGIVRFDDTPIDLARARAMLDQLAHRGPDASGLSNLGRCVLVHTRLAIIEPAGAGGAQPMHAPPHGESGTLSVAFNGEVYNHRELRRQLESLGHRFASDHSDTEVLLHGYRQWGAELPRRLEGMFALAIWDQTARSLYLCRDRAGKKPLFIRCDDGQVVFGSLPATVLTDVAKPAVDRDALHDYLAFGYTRDASLFQGVSELPAAHWMLIDAGGAVRTERYWSPPEAGAGRSEDLREAIIAAVERRLESDVPLGCFLSGGIDSSLVAAIAQQRLRTMHCEPLRTFSVAMPDQDYDESAFARLVATHIGARHTELAVSAGDRDVIGDLTRLIEQTGEPTADSSILPTYWLSKATRAHVRTVLSGDGGDELFGGYDRYRAMRILARHRWWLSRLPIKPAGHEKSRRDRLSRLVDAARHTAPAVQYRAMMPLFSDSDLLDLGIPAEPDADPIPDWPGGDDPVRAAMRWDFAHYLRYDLLRKVDRASMSVALEVRCPLLDRRVCELAAGLATQTLMPGGRPKGCLRHLASQWLPASIVERPKQGFALPIGRWFRQSLHKPLCERLLDGPLDTLDLRRAPIERLLDEHADGTRDHTHRLFALLSLSLWAQRWIGR